MLATATAQTLPSPMPTGSPQYKIVQQIISAMHGFENECENFSGTVGSIFYNLFEVYQSTCGAYFVSEKPPLEVIDLALTDYLASSAWQSDFEDTYSRDFEFGSGTLSVELDEFSILDEASIIISYRVFRPGAR